MTQAKPNQISLQFQVMCYDLHTDLQLFLIGNVSQLRNWDTRIALPFEFINGVWRAKVWLKQARINQVLEYKMFKTFKENGETHLKWQNFIGNRSLSLVTFFPLLIKLEFNNISQKIVSKTVQLFQPQHSNVFQVLDSLDELKDSRKQSSDEDQDMFHQYPLENYFKYCSIDKKQQNNDSYISRQKTQGSSQASSERDW